MLLTTRRQVFAFLLGGLAAAPLTYWLVYATGSGLAKYAFMFSVFSAAIGALFMAVRATNDDTYAKVVAAGAELARDSDTWDKFMHRVRAIDAAIGPDAQPCDEDPRLLSQLRYARLILPTDHIHAGLVEGGSTVITTQQAHGYSPDEDFSA